jgi:hypothetical protein
MSASLDATQSVYAIALSFQIHLDNPPFRLSIFFLLPSALPPRKKGERDFHDARCAYSLWTLT